MRLTVLLTSVVSLVACVSAWANPCALPGQYEVLGSGIGGTGHRDDGSGIGGTSHSSGMGGTGIRPEGGGVGGTGHRNDGSGMGGTGTQADGSGKGGTGVVGVITGFGSICVNGLELHYDGNTPILVDGERKTASHLAIGQLVAAEAEGHGQSLRARQIAVNSMLSGPVSWVSPAGDSIVAMGQKVRLPSAGMAWRPRAGDHVRVNGLPEAGGMVRATSIERIAPSDRVSVQGRVDHAAQGVARIGSLVVTSAKSVRTGDVVRVVGHLEGSHLKAQRIEVKPGLGFSSRVNRVVLQGVAKPAQSVGKLSLGYAEIELPSGMEAKDLARPGDLLRIEASRRPDGLFEARSIVIDRPVREMQPRLEHDGVDRDDDGARHKERGEGREHDATDRHERSERAQKPEREGREDAIEKRERPERGESRERFEKPERPEKIELPEKPELPERVELPELPELPERHDD